MGSVGQHQDELFAAVARRQVRGPAARLANGVGDLAQRLITVQMTKVVVISLEIVDIDHQKRQLRLVAHGPAPFQFHILIKMPAVGQSSQPIGVHQLLQHQVGVEQLLLADPQGAVGFIALQQGHVRA
ncbi:hypothetical protein D3C76_1414010 [compost metagenome]